MVAGGVAVPWVLEATRVTPVGVPKIPWVQNELSATTWGTVRLPKASLRGLAGVGQVCLGQNLCPPPSPLGPTIHLVPFRGTHLPNGCRGF